MFMEERQKDIVRRLNETGRIIVSEIQEIYGVSADCARRDLRELERKGLLRRTHGGALPAEPKGIYPEKTYTPKDLPDGGEKELSDRGQKGIGIYRTAGSSIYHNLLRRLLYGT